MTAYAIAATGTGGHIFPALSVARALHAQGHEIVWFGSPSGMEVNYMQGFEYVPLEVGPINGQTGQMRKLMDSFKAVPKVQERLMRFSVSKAIVFGGYVSVPVGLAAKSTKIPLYVQEQNSKPGRANKMLMPLSEKIFAAHHGVFDSDKIVVTGNPLRFSRPWLKPNNVLVIGGSLGSGFINEIMHEVAGNNQCNFRIIVGSRNFNPIKAKFAGMANVEILEFIDDMYAQYEWADAVISRAGAMTISEVSAMQLPALLIPLANSADGHQVKNAYSAGANFEVMLESACSAVGIRRWLENGPKSALDRILQYLV